MSALEAMWPILKSEHNQTLRGRRRIRCSSTRLLDHPVKATHLLNLHPALAQITKADTLNSPLLQNSFPVHDQLMLAYSDCSRDMNSMRKNRASGQREDRRRQCFAVPPQKTSRIKKQRHKLSEFQLWHSQDKQHHEHKQAANRQPVLILR